MMTPMAKSGPGRVISQLRPSASQDFGPCAVNSFVYACCHWANRRIFKNLSLFCPYSYSNVFGTKAVKVDLCVSLFGHISISFPPASDNVQRRSYFALSHEANQIGEDHKALWNLPIDRLGQQRTFLSPSRQSSQSLLSARKNAIFNFNFAIWVV